MIPPLRPHTVIKTIRYRCRPYTRQCLANTSVATVGPTVGTTSNLRSLRQKREAIDSLRDQDNQEKSDLQGTIAFYQKLCFIQRQFVIAYMQAGGSETPRSNPCQFSTFKSSPSGRAASDPASLDLAGLNLGHRETVAPSRAAEFNSSTSRDYYQQPISRFRERSPNASSRQLDKQGSFFHGHKTEKDIDREAVVFVSNRPDYPRRTYFGRLVKEMGGAEHEEKKQKGSTLGDRKSVV